MTAPRDGGGRAIPRPPSVVDFPRSSVAVRALEILPVLASAAWQRYNGHMAESLETTPGFAVLKLLKATDLVEKGRDPSIELRAAVRRGLPFSKFEALLKAVALPQKQLIGILGIPERTIARRKAAKHLTAAESDRLYRVARTIAQVISVLGSMEKARAWITRPNQALGDESPLALLDTDIGTRQVEDVLLRIEYGIHS